MLSFRVGTGMPDRAVAYAITRNASRTGARARSLETILTALRQDPPELPGWSSAQWRSALRRPAIIEQLRPLLADGRIADLAGWAASRAVPGRELGALAAALGVLDREIHANVPDPLWVERTAQRLEQAVGAARSQSRRWRSQAHMLPTPDLDRQPAEPTRRPQSPSPFPALAADLLSQAGFDLGAHLELTRRLAVALDVAVAHWVAGAEPGTGLPGFRRETKLHSPKRLTALLGADRDLLYLVYGPQPGRGRPLDVARRRGLAYWAALALRARHVGEPFPGVPASVLAHWRRELARLDALPGEDVSADRSEAPCA